MRKGGGSGGGICYLGKRGGNEKTFGNPHVRGAEREMWLRLGEEGTDVGDINSPYTTAKEKGVFPSLCLAMKMGKGMEQIPKKSLFNILGGERLF